jgi:hypothetical protein
MTYLKARFQTLPGATKKWYEDLRVTSFRVDIRSRDPYIMKHYEDLPSGSKAISGGQTERLTI